jgi:hypothetical protein
MTPRQLWALIWGIAASRIVHRSSGFLSGTCFPCRRPFSYYRTHMFRPEQPSPHSLRVQNATDTNTNNPTTIHGTKSLPQSTMVSLEERTHRFLYGASPEEGDQLWLSTEDYFQEAQGLMIGWSHRHSRKSALMVERIIRRVIQAQEDGAVSPSSLDMASMYTCAIRGWANSNERGPAAQRAEEILDTLQQCYTEGGHEGMKPGMEAFNLVLLAYARSGMTDAPQQALRVLEKMHRWYTTGASDVAPNKESFATVLRAYAKTGKPNAPGHVKRLLEHMERLAEEEGYISVRPDYMCHGAYVSALIDAMDRDFITGEEAANKAEEYLFELLASPYEDARPDSWIFNMVLAAHSKSYTEDMVERADRLMQVFEAYHEMSGRSEKTRPNTVSYNFLLAAYSRSSWRNQGERAHAVLRRMHSLVASGNNTAARPDAVTYNTGMSCLAKECYSQFI